MELRQYTYKILDNPQSVLLRKRCMSGWLELGRIFLVERTEDEPFDRIAGIE